MRTAQDSKMMVQLKPELYLMPCRACEPCSKTLDQLCMCIYIYMYIYIHIYNVYTYNVYIYIYIYGSRRAFATTVLVCAGTSLVPMTVASFLQATCFTGCWSR